MARSTEKNQRRGSKSLRGRTVVITRASSQSGPFRTRLERLGARVLECPVIRIVPPRDWKPLDRALRNLSAFDWILFTSANGVEYFFKRLLKNGKDARALFGIKIGGVGEATRDVLAARGIRADLVPDRHTSEGLCAALKARRWIEGARYLLPRTDLAPDYLARTLEGAGARVTEVTAYQTEIADPKKIRAWIWRHLPEHRSAEAIFFTSASTAGGFFSALNRAERSKFKTPIFSIGPMTTRALRELGLKPFREADPCTAEGLIQALCRALAPGAGVGGRCRRPVSGLRAVLKKRRIE